jgi:hypothetical protein
VIVTVKTQLLRKKTSWELRKINKFVMLIILTGPNLIDERKVLKKAPNQ